ncbi:organic hydroperoxide resistance protein [Nocardioides massiliensis]|uniref:Ohr subfamily peroxiredoxin n=1 Tax=Nocardioides massiliensis TaxID=1325935 RepID=A0ABT9NPC2_9ACTN|nr:organic hydroperoxide resistance protein [Nocardioides massiliensis]MDP9822059.1 Ohr subfamily peroxiredoxin [Nocardioides massiliensis]
MTNTPDEIQYTARVQIVGGRQGGRAVSEDGVMDVQLTAPKETGGPGTGTNPEQLFAMGYGACFQSALTAVAKKAGVDASESTVEVAVGFGPHDKSFALTVELTGRIPGVDAEQAQELMEAAHEICPYSKATRGNVPVTLRGVVATEASETP